MLVGQAPFAGSMAQVMSQHLSKPPPFEKLDKLPPPVADVLRLMLAKDPADRFQTPNELRKAIEVAIGKITGAGGAPAMTAEAVEQTEDFATLLDDSSMRSGMGSSRRIRRSPIATAWRSHAGKRMPARFSAPTIPSGRRKCASLCCMPKR
jgi:serine/threonine-protein kinase